MSDPFFVGIPILIPTEITGQLMVRRKFAFYDSRGVKWTAEEGSIVDGASIPSALKPLLGHSFETPFLAAAVLHDIYCQSKTRSRKETNDMFLEALITNGVNWIKAYLMWAAVAAFGPRW